MKYKRVDWKNEPDTSTPISADNLNVMDEGIENAYKELNYDGDRLTGNKYDENNGMIITAQETAKEEGYTLKSYVKDFVNFFSNCAKGINDLLKKVKKNEQDINSLNSSLVNLSDEVKNISKYAYSTTGWADVFKQMGAVGDIGIGMTNLHNAINTTYSSSGVYDVYANGPVLGVVLMRTSAEFYSGLIVFYREQAIAYSFARADGYFYARRISSYAAK